MDFLDISLVMLVFVGTLGSFFFIAWVIGKLINFILKKTTEGRFGFCGGRCLLWLICAGLLYLSIREGFFTDPTVPRYLKYNISGLLSLGLFAMFPIKMKIEEEEDDDD